MDFAARRSALEAQRQALAGASTHEHVAPKVAKDLPEGWREGDCEWRSGYELGRDLTQELRRINAALARLREGSYGFCLMCGDDIADSFLDKNPATPFCEDCCARSEHPSPRGTSGL